MFFYGISKAVVGRSVIYFLDHDWCGGPCSLWAVPLMVLGGTGRQVERVIRNKPVSTTPLFSASVSVSRFLPWLPWVMDSKWTFSSPSCVWSCFYHSSKLRQAPWPGLPLSWRLVWFQWLLVAERYLMLPQIHSFRREVAFYPSFYTQRHLKYSEAAASEGRVASGIARFPSRRSPCS